jgi:hypothetical protein
MAVVCPIVDASGPVQLQMSPTTMGLGVVASAAAETTSRPDAARQPTASTLKMDAATCLNGRVVGFGTDGRVRAGTSALKVMFPPFGYSGQQEEETNLAI